MAEPSPPPDPFAAGVAAELKEEPYRFDFFQAVRLLERATQGEAAGSDAPPAGEAVRFRTHATNAFPASQIQELRPARDGKPTEMVVNFFGLVGSFGALPQPYTDLVVERRTRFRDRTLHDFLNLFHHRLLSLFYKAWAKYRVWRRHEAAGRIGRARRAVGEAAEREFELSERPALDPASQALLDVSGLGGPALRYRIRERDRLVGRTAIADETLRFFAGLLSPRHRPAVGLEALLGGYFGWPARVRQFVGRWLVLDNAERSRLGVRGRSEPGVSLVAGRQVYDVQGKFRVTLGPLSYTAFEGFLPNGAAHRPLKELTRLYAGPDLEFDLELRLKPEEVPPCRPGAADGPTPRLGWNTWLTTRPFEGEPAVVLAPGDRD